MPYIALERRRDGDFKPELESKEEQVRVNGEYIEVYGWVDDDTRIAVILSVDELPEEARREIAEEEVKKAARLLNSIRAIMGAKEV